MKKFLAIALCAIMALSFVACSNELPEKDTSDQDNQQSVQPPNPIQDCATLADAEQLAGFTLTLPETMPEDFAQSYIQAIDGNMIQVCYKHGEDEILIRKANDTGDISGDYNDYAEKSTITVGDLQVSIRGNNGKVNVATWTDGGYSFSICVYMDGTGIDNSALIDMISCIK